MAFLAVMEQPPPFSSIDELVEQDEFMFGTLGESALETMFKVNWYPGLRSNTGQNPAMLPLVTFDHSFSMHD